MDSKANARFNNDESIINEQKKQNNEIFEQEKQVQQLKYEESVKNSKEKFIAETKGQDATYQEFKNDHKQIDQKINEISKDIDEKKSIFDKMYEKFQGAMIRISDFFAKIDVTRYLEQLLTANPNTVTSIDKATITPTPTPIDPLSAEKDTKETLKLMTDVDNNEPFSLIN